jgi:hypothetical protein
LIFSILESSFRSKHLAGWCSGSTLNLYYELCSGRALSTEVFHGFHQCLHWNTTIVPPIKPWFLPSKSPPVHPAMYVCMFFRGGFPHAPRPLYGLLYVPFLNFKSAAIPSQRDGAACPTYQRTAEPSAGGIGDYVLGREMSSTFARSAVNILHGSNGLKSLPEDLFPEFFRP